MSEDTVSCERVVLPFSKKLLEKRLPARTRTCFVRPVLALTEMCWRVCQPENERSVKRGGNAAGSREAVGGRMHQTDAPEVARKTAKGWERRIDGSTGPPAHPTPKEQSSPRQQAVN